MADSSFSQAVNQIFPLSGADTIYFLSLFEVRSFKRHAVLLSEGQVAHELFFIQKGVLRQCFVNEDGIERTCNIALENEFITDLESFSTQSPAMTKIVALEPVTCLVSNCVTIGQAIRNSKEMADFFRFVVEQVAQEGIRRTKSMLAYSPDRRFEELMAAKPELVQRVPQRYIAQYLGIAPESLSRIRKRLMTHSKP